MRRFDHSRNLNQFFKLACAVAALSLPATAALLFDNADAPLYTTSRISSIEGAAAYLQIGTSNVSIGQIAINAQPLQAGQLKFVIFSDVASPGSASGTLLYSDTVNVSAANAPTYIFSDPFSFTLRAGYYYDVGAIFSGAAINYTYDFTTETEGDISSLAGAQNVDNFASPAQVGHGGVSDISIRLYSPTVTTVPEPASYGLGVVSFAVVALTGYRRRVVILS